MDNTLATGMHNIQCSMNHTRRTSPGVLTFYKEMFVDFPILADFITIQNIRQWLIDTNILSYNCIYYDYLYTLEQRLVMKQ